MEKKYAIWFKRTAPWNRFPFGSGPKVPRYRPNRTSFVVSRLLTENIKRRLVDEPLDELAANRYRFIQQGREGQYCTLDSTWVFVEPCSYGADGIFQVRAPREIRDA